MGHAYRDPRRSKLWLTGDSVMEGSRLHTVAQMDTRVGQRGPQTDTYSPARAFWFGQVDCPSVSHLVTEGSMRS